MLSKNAYKKEGHCSLCYVEKGNHRFPGTEITSRLTHPTSHWIKNPHCQGFQTSRCLYSSGSCQEVLAHAKMRSESRGELSTWVWSWTRGLSLGSATTQLCYLEQVTCSPVLNLLLCKTQQVTVPAHRAICENWMKSLIQGDQPMSTS